MKKKITIAIYVIAGMLLLSIVGWAWYWSRNLLVIENESGKMVEVVTVTVCGKSYQLKDLPSGETKRVAFMVTGDSGFQFDVSFDDGGRVLGNFGYVTGGAGAYNNRVVVNIQPDRIDGKQQ